MQNFQIDDMFDASPLTPGFVQAVAMDIITTSLPSAPPLSVPSLLTPNPNAEETTRVSHTCHPLAQPRDTDVIADEYKSNGEQVENEDEDDDENDDENGGDADVIVCGNCQQRFRFSQFHAFVAHKHCAHANCKQKPARNTRTCNNLKSASNAFKEGAGDTTTRSGAAERRAEPSKNMSTNLNENDKELLSSTIRCAICSQTFISLAELIGHGETVHHVFLLASSSVSSSSSMSSTSALPGTACVSTASATLQQHAQHQRHHSLSSDFSGATTLPLQTPSSQQTAFSQPPQSQQAPFIPINFISPPCNCSVPGAQPSACSQTSASATPLNISNMSSNTMANMMANTMANTNGGVTSDAVQFVRGPLPPSNLAVTALSGSNTAPSVAAPPIPAASGHISINSTTSSSAPVYTESAAVAPVGDDCAICVIQHQHQFASNMPPPPPPPLAVNATQIITGPPLLSSSSSTVDNNNTHNTNNNSNNNAPATNLLLPSRDSDDTTTSACPINHPPNHPSNHPPNHQSSANPQHLASSNNNGQVPAHLAAAATSESAVSFSFLAMVQSPPTAPAISTHHHNINKNSSPSAAGGSLPIVSHNSVPPHPTPPHPTPTLPIQLIRPEINPAIPAVPHIAPTLMDASTTSANHHHQQHSDNTASSSIANAVAAAADIPTSINDVTTLPSITTSTGIAASTTFTPVSSSASAVSAASSTNSAVAAPLQHLQSSSSKHDGKFLCKVCKKAFRQNVHCRKHYVSKHAAMMKPHRCDDCSYTTVEKSHLTVHRRTHTGERPFVCRRCDYSSAQNCTLKSHYLRRHPGDRTFCESCGNDFITDQEKLKHEKTCKTATVQH